MINESLKTKIINHLVCHTGSKEWYFTDTKIDSTDCTVYRLSSPNYSKDIALKLYHKDKSSKKEPHYSAIKRFSYSLNHGGGKYRAPNPYGFFENENCFLMEWATGENLKEHLWKSCLQKGNTQIHIREAFIWLKHYHQYASPSLKQVDTKRYVKRIESHCKRLNFEELLIDNETYKDGYDVLISFAQHFIEYETIHADIHGDLNLSNIILDHDHVTGIDIGAKENAPIENDMAQMLNYICINYFNMLTRFDMRKSIESWEIFNVIFDSYEYPRDQKARDFFLFVFLYQMLLRWVSIKHIHSSSSNNTISFRMLGKWRLHNSAAIVQGLTKYIKENYKC